MTHFLRKYKKSFFYCLFAFSAIIVLVIANFLSSLILPANSHGDKIFAQSFDLHLISLSKSQVEKESKARAEDFSISLTIEKLEKIILNTRKKNNV